MNSRRGMADISLRLADRNASAGQSRDDGHASRMEAGICSDFFFQAVTVEKFKPLGAGPLPDSTFGGGPSRCAAVGAERGEERNELWMQCGDEIFSAFGLEGNRHFIEVNVVLRIDSGFGEPAALIPSDLETVLQHFPNARISDQRDLAADEIAICLRQFGFEFARMLFEAELHARVAGAEFALNCFLQDDAEDFEFEQRGIVAGFILTFALVGLLAPLDIIEAMLSGEVNGSEDLALFKEELNGGPSRGVAFEGGWLVLVSDLDEAVDPLPTSVTFIASAFQLIERFLGLHLARATNVRSAINAALSGKIFGLTALPEFKPEVGTSFSFVKAGHTVCNLVSLTIQNPAKTSKYSPMLAKAGKAKFEPGVRIPLSPPLDLPRFSSSVSPECNSRWTVSPESAAVLLALFFIFFVQVRSQSVPGQGVKG